jgi:hypothetical protein
MTDRAAVVGQQVRRIDDRTHSYTAWAQITLMVPSQSGDCWLVSFIDDPDAHYQFLPTATTPKGD